MTDTLIHMAKKFFGDLQALPKGRDELAQFDKKVEFEVSDDESFTVEVKEGNVSVYKGITDPADMEALRFITGRDVLAKLFGVKVRFTDVYTHMVERDPDRAKKRLYVREQTGVGGTSGGVLVRWFARLIRIGQELP